MIHLPPPFKQGRVPQSVEKMMHLRFPFKQGRVPQSLEKMIHLPPPFKQGRVPQSVEKMMHLRSPFKLGRVPQSVASPCSGRSRQSPVRCRAGLVPERKGRGEGGDQKKTTGCSCPSRLLDGIFRSSLFT